MLHHPVLRADTDRHAGFHQVRSGRSVQDDRTFSFINLANSAFVISFSSFSILLGRFIRLYCFLAPPHLFHRGVIHTFTASSPRLTLDAGPISLFWGFLTPPRFRCGAYFTLLLLLSPASLNARSRAHVTCRIVHLYI